MKRLQQKVYCPTRHLIIEIPQLSINNSLAPIQQFNRYVINESDINKVECECVEYRLPHVVYHGFTCNY